MLYREKNGSVWRLQGIRQPQLASCRFLSFQDLQFFVTIETVLNLSRFPNAIMSWNVFSFTIYLLFPFIIINSSPVLVFYDVSVDFNPLCSFCWSYRLPFHSSPTMYVLILSYFWAFLGLCRDYFLVGRQELRLSNYDAFPSPQWCVV